jgi:hypothetical protein
MRWLGSFFRARFFSHFSRRGKIVKTCTTCRTDIGPFIRLVTVDDESRGEYPVVSDELLCEECHEADLQGVRDV